MLVTKSLIPIPSRKVIVDLALRNGSPERGSTCPYNGRARFVYEQTKDFAGSVIGLLSKPATADYNAHKQKPVPGPYRQRDSAEVERTVEYLTKLEDIDASWVYKYFENAVIGIKINAMNSIKEERKKHQEQRTFEDMEGDLVSEADLLIEKPKYSYVDVLSWKEKVPYIIKRLHEKSKSCGVSIMSLLIAYERVLRANPGKDPKPTQVLEEGVYKMEKSGKISLRIMINKGPFHDHAMKWIRGQEGHVDSYLKDAMELLDICERLDIDIRNEDAEEYQEDYINSLTVLYITKNRDFFSSQSRSLNTAVLKELKQVVLDDYNKRTVTDQKLDWRLITGSKMQKFLDSDNPAIDRNQNKEQEILIFMSLHDISKNVDSRIGRKRTRDGFYLNNGSNPLLIDVTDITLDPNPNYQKVSALLHSSGYLVLVTNTKQLYYLDIVTAIQYQNDFNQKQVRDHKRYERNQKFGKWEETLR
jgi:hypothetical protein